MVSLTLNPARAQVTDDFETTSCPTIGCGNGLINNGCLANWATSHGTPHVFPGFFGNQGGFNSSRSLRMVYGPMNQSQWGGEGAFRTASFKPDKCYVIKLWIYPTISESIDGIFRVRLTNNLTEDLDLGTCHEPVPSVTGITQNLLEENISNYTLNNWQQLTLSFTPTDEFSQLWLYLAPTITQTTLPVGGTIRVDNLEITEYSLPKAGFTYEIDPMCGSGTVSFQNVSQNADTYLWNFGDGETSTTENPVHTYDDPGTYTVTLTASNECGEDVETQTIVVSATTYDWVVPGTTTLSNAVTFGWLPANGVTNESVQINGILTIDQDEYTFQGANVTMESGAGIVVNGGEKLWINNSNFMGCEYMWRGIHILAEAYVYVLDNSFIADAEFAIRSESKSRVTIQNSRFDRNFISLFHQGPLAFVLFPFFGNEITCSGPLLAAYPQQLTTLASQSYAGILVNDQKPLVIGSDVEAPNTFANLRNGIITTRSNLTVRNTKFENIIQSSEYTDLTGYGIRHTGIKGHDLIVEGMAQNYVVFQNCTTGIQATGTDANIILTKMEKVVSGIRLEGSSLGSLKVENNLISTQMNGVELHQHATNAEIRIKNNTIRVNETPAFPLPLSGDGISINETNVTSNLAASISDNQVTVFGFNDTGIRLRNAHDYDIETNKVMLSSVAGYIGMAISGGAGNTLKGNTVMGTGTFGTGINLYMAGDIKLDCDTLQGLGTGLNVIGNQSDADIATTLFLLTMHTGLRYVNGVMAPIQNGRGNVWAGTASDYAGFGARHEGMSLNMIQDNAYRVLEPYNSGASLNPYPPSIRLTNFPTAAVTNWFPLTGVSAALCDEEELEEDDDEKIKLARLIAADNMQAFPAGTQWDARWGLYRKLQKYPYLVEEDTLLSAFFNEAALEPLGQFVTMEARKTALFAPTAETEAIALLVDTLNQLTGEIQALDSMMLANATTTESPERQNLAEQVSAKMALIEALTSTSDSIRRAKAAVLIASNAAIVPGNLPEENQQLVNELYLKAIVKGDFSFTAGQKDTLKGIAIQCPEYGGRAVFAARALKASYAPQVYNETETCIPVPESLALLPQSPEELAGTALQVFPNPAGDYFLLSCDLSFPAELRLYDLYGRVRKTQNLAAGKISAEKIGTTELENGMYLITLRLDNGELFNIRLLIVK